MWALLGSCMAQACDGHLMTWKCAASYRRTIWSLLAVMIRVPPVRGWKISMAFVIPLSLVVTRILHTIHAFIHSFWQINVSPPGQACKVLIGSVYGIAHQNITKMMQAFEESNMSHPCTFKTWTYLLQQPSCDKIWQRGLSSACCMQDRPSDSD